MARDRTRRPGRGHAARHAGPDRQGPTGGGAPGLLGTIRGRRRRRSGTVGPIQLLDNNVGSNPACPSRHLAGRSGVPSWLAESRQSSVRAVRAMSGNGLWQLACRPIHGPPPPPTGGVSAKYNPSVISKSSSDSAAAGGCTSTSPQILLHIKKPWCLTLKVTSAVSSAASHL